ncbi:hypothetical protein BgiMline_015648 [Biomphalaria glabrata]|nr:hypothetical protein BgiMline_008466 [Biomphalaria glabrata]
MRNHHHFRMHLKLSTTSIGLSPLCWSCVGVAFVQLMNQIKCGVKHGGLCRLLQHHNENRCNWSFVRKLSISLIQHRQDFEASIRGSQRPIASLMTPQQFS